MPSQTSEAGFDVVEYLLRIGVYDLNGPHLNSITKINPGVLAEAKASDRYRASELPARPLEGIPYTIKDGYKYLGMTVAAGSPAFKDLVANEDAFVVEKLKEAGAVLIGRTNMPPMAAGGMQRGLYGRAESPYNPEYLTAAFSSGSSNGAATSTAASFATFALGSETVSSGRSPASNNALVAYTPSRGLISCRGLWPLYATCDVPVPYTRSIKDMIEILQILTQKDATAIGDFWREQSFVKIPTPTLDWSLKPTSLEGKRVGVPRMYIGGSGGKPVVVSPGVIALWEQARADLEALGAEVIPTDFPLVTNYEDDSISQEPNNVVGAPSNWNQIERGPLIAKCWDKFLKENGNSAGMSEVDGHQLFPKPVGYLPDKYFEAKNFVNYPGLIELAREPGSVWDIPGMAKALQSLEAQRKRDFEDWLDEQRLNFVVFPANGDVGRADLEENMESARFALQNGVKYSNGNRAIRHLGVPTISVPMGVLDIGIPVNLTFAGKAYTDDQLINYAYAYEQKSQRRVAPSLTPVVKEDLEMEVGAQVVFVNGLRQENISSKQPQSEQPIGRVEPAQKMTLCVWKDESGHYDANLALE